MPTTIDFYFDFSSSYTYVALPGLAKLANERAVSLNWKPIALGVIFKAMNHAPPVGDTPKGRYTKHDVARAAAIAGLPHKWPEPFPFNSLTAARAFWYLADSDTDKAVEWARAVFHASHGEGRDCSNPEVLAGIAADLGHDAQALLAAAGTDAAKAKLKEVTGEAMERGVFGAPTLFVGDEMFWGSDRVSHLEHYLDNV